MIRDLMVECVECRFNAARPQPVQWLSDNGSAYATAGTIEIATALNLTPCFTPVESPEGNGVADAFVNTFKRDYIRIKPLTNAETALNAVADWMNDYNEVDPHSGLAYRSPKGIQRAIATRCVSGLTGSAPLRF
jgi:transposase InsO family protein